jgi:hypothetical protein
MQAFQPGKWRILTVPARLKTASFAMQSADQLTLCLERVACGWAIQNKLLFNTATSAIMLPAIKTLQIHDRARG